MRAYGALIAEHFGGVAQPDIVVVLERQQAIGRGLA